jgi:hypothetical protein
VTDEVDITAKELPPVAPREARRPSDPLEPGGEPVSPAGEGAPVRARPAVLLSETQDQLPSLPDVPAVAATQTLDDEVEALAGEPRAPPAPARAVRDLPPALPASRPVRKKTHGLPAQSDGFEGPSLEALPRVEAGGPAPPVSAGIHWSTADWVVAALVLLMVLSVALVFCAV